VLRRGRPYSVQLNNLGSTVVGDVRWLNKIGIRQKLSRGQNVVEGRRDISRERLASALASMSAP
jgi:hypothetical protein